MIKDRNIGYKYKKDWFPATSFNCYSLVDEDDGAATTTATLTSNTSGAPVQTKVAALGIAGTILEDVNDFIRLTMPMPSHWDYDNDIFFRVLWIDGGIDDSESVTFTIKWKTYQFQQALVAGVGGGGSDSITIAADANSTVSDSLDATAWGKLNAGTWGDDVSFVALDVELTTDGSDLDPVVVGLEVAYIPKLTSGTQVSDQSAPTDA